MKEKVTIREVRAGALSGMKSPIRHVMAHIHEAIVNIAREREGEFDHTFSEFVLEYLDDHQWICRVDRAKKHIWLSRKVMEVLWAASLAYFRLYDQLQRVMAGRSSISIELNLRNGGVLQEGMRLLQWALNAWINNLDGEWPIHLPKPVPGPREKSDEHVSDELALCAIAFMLHHELSHIRLQHQGGNQVAAEREADEAATNWILVGVPDQQDWEFIKRTFGMAVALAVPVAYGIHTGKYGGRTHPRSYDRLIHELDRYVHDPNHDAWFFVTTILTLHLDNADHEAQVSKGPFNSARECVDAYVKALSHISGI